MMDIDDAPLLHEPDLMLAVLRVAAAGSGTLDACVAHLRALRRCAKVDQLVPEADIRRRLQAVAAKLDRARLIERPAANGFHITARGRQALADYPGGIDDGVLMKLEGINGRIRHGEAPQGTGLPSCSEYDVGYDAFGEGLGLADNPYPLDARGHLDWQNGWSQARDDHLQQRVRKPSN
jgi:hypothetical protein